jgi:hypothetical protein
MEVDVPRNPGGGVGELGSQSLTQYQRAARKRPGISEGRTATGRQTCVWRRASGPPVPGENRDIRTARPNEEDSPEQMRMANAFCRYLELASGL